ncbi:MAG: helix-turn-helix domain-containing protein [Coleofasciculus sp. G1-WW12-02]|uniref:helix-turn-helix domain-containing protein n=1 Tax=Coleofasciculus sp. G1-WW12-02 TaxID=3068483 RepID=UPI003303F5F0
MKTSSLYLTPFQRKRLQKSLQGDLATHYRQRIEIMLLADEGKTQTEICKRLGCCPATARHWILMAHSGMAHQWQDSPRGRPKAVNEDYLERLQELVSRSPREFGYSFQRWTANWLAKHLAQEFGIQVSDRHINRLLTQMGLSTRQKPSHTPEQTPQRVTSISIQDLPSASVADAQALESLHVAKSGENTDIYGHGARFIHAVSFSRTAQSYPGVFPFSQRVSGLSPSI